MFSLLFILIGCGEKEVDTATEETEEVTEDTSLED